MLRKIAKAIGIGIAVAGMILNLGCANPTRNLDVVIVATYDDTVTIETPDGEIWRFYGTGFENSTRATVTFENGMIVDAAPLD